MRLIDADALIKAIPNTDADIFENCRRCNLLDKEQVIAIINNAPTIEAEPVRQGKWIGTEYDGYADGSPIYYEWICSECKTITEDDEPIWNYCPHCGAKMKGEEE